ncbi:GyrI-like domain-containing protein [Sinomicrobium sp.]
MKILKYLFFLILILFVGLSVYIATQPSEYRIHHSRLIHGNPQLVYSYISNLKNWKAWSFFPDDNNPSYGEPFMGIGGNYSWSSGKETFNLTTISATPYTHIEQELSTEKQKKAVLSWEFREQDQNTEVSLTIDGKMDFTDKAKALYYRSSKHSIEPEVYKSFKLIDSTITENLKQYSISIDGITEQSGGFYLYTTTSSRMSDSGKKIATQLKDINTYIKENNISNTGIPFTYYHSRDEENNAVIFSNGVFTTSRVITDPESNILTGKIEPFKALKVTLNGDTKNLPEAWKSAFSYLKERQIAQDSTGPYMEFYPSDASSTPNPAKWVTEILIPVHEINMPPIVE